MGPTDRRRFWKMRRRIRGKDRGSVLIPVLAVILSCTMIVSALLALSQTGVYGIVSHTQLQRSSYVCEGAMNRVQWLVTAERASYPNVSLRNFDYADSSYDRFLPDGVVHEMDYHGTALRFTLTDASAGLDFSRQYRTATLRNLTSDPSADEEYLDRMETLSSILGDYVDSDDSAVSSGLESGDYETSGQRPLPRNAEFQYREELYWIPGFTELFPPDKYGRLSAVRVIPPSSMAEVRTMVRQGPQTVERSTPLLASRPNLFGAGDAYLRNVCRLSDSELEQIREAIRLYQTERIPLEDSLEGTLLTTLNNAVSWNAGSTVTAVIEPAGSGTPSRRLAATWTVPSSAAGPEDGVVRWLEWMFF